MKGFGRLLALLLVALAGCGSPATETPAGLPADTPVAASATPTRETPATPLAFATATLEPPVPTDTPGPPPATSTPTPSLPVATATPFPSPTAEPTPDAMPGDVTPTDTPGPPVPTAEPTVGYTPTNTYQVQTLLVGSGQPGRLYAWLEGFWWADDLPGRLLVSDDLGATWHPFEGGNVRPVGIDYASGALYGQTNDGLSRWDGSQWALVSPEEITKVAVQFGEPEKMWGIAQAQVARSEDGGRTWQLQPGNGVPLDLFLNPKDPGYVYLVAHSWGQHSLSRTTGNYQWNLLPKPDNPGQPVGTWRDIRGVAVDGDSGATYLMLANIIGSFSPAGSQLWRSDNLNAPDVTTVSWSLLQDFGPDVQALLLASGWNPAGAGPALYANFRSEYCPAEGGTCAPEPPWVLHRSLDGGQSWESIAIPETAHE